MLSFKKWYPLHLFFIFAVFSIVSAQVNLDGRIVPKDSIIVFLAIGHSNMAGRADTDHNTHPRAWNFRFGPGDYGWEPAKDPLHGYEDNNNCTVVNRGSMAFQFLKRIAEEYPCYYFGMLMNANSKGTIRWDANGNTCRPPCGNRFYRKGGCQYEELIAEAKKLKGKVTFGGVIAQIGFIESRESLPHAQCFGEDVAQAIRDMREDLDEPNLPLLIGRYEETGSDIVNHRQYVIDGIRNIPNILPYSGVIESDGPYVDGHHYNAEGHRRWADSAAVLHRRKGWLLCETTIDNDAPSRPTGLTVDSFNSNSAEIHWNSSDDNIGVTEYRIYNGNNMLTAVDGSANQTILTGLSSETDFTISVKAVDAAGNLSEASNEASFTTDAAQFATIPLSVNAGGDSQDGFVSDKEWAVGGDYGYYDLPGASNPTVQTCVAEPIEGTDLDEIFYCVRYRDFGYKFRVENGAYSVKLMFTELWRDSPNNRQFSIKVQNQMLPEMPFDIFDEADGRGKAYIIITDAVVSDKMLDIQFLRTNGESPIVSALSIDNATVYTLNSPNGNESFSSGDQVQIIWSTNLNIINEAEIDFTINAGTDWFPVNDTTIKEGDQGWQNYTWTVPDMINNEAISSSECAIRIRDYEKTFIEYSDEFFSINSVNARHNQSHKPFYSNTSQLVIAGKNLNFPLHQGIDKVSISSINGKRIFAATTVHDFKLLAQMEISNGIYPVKIQSKGTILLHFLTIVK